MNRKQSLTPSAKSQILFNEEIKKKLVHGLKQIKAQKVKEDKEYERSRKVMQRELEKIQAKKRTLVKKK